MGTLNDTARLRRKTRKAISIPSIVPDSGKTQSMLLMERILCQPIESYLANRLKDGCILEEIAKELRVSVPTVSRWIKQLGIIG